MELKVKMTLYGLFLMCGSNLDFIIQRYIINLIRDGKISIVFVNDETVLMLKKILSNIQKLQVRVCGWNEYFDRMNKEMQYSFISQLKSECEEH